MLSEPVRIKESLNETTEKNLSKIIAIFHKGKVNMYLMLHESCSPEESV